MADITGFRREYRRRAKEVEGVREVKFFGSILDPDRFFPGVSDVDIAVYGDIGKHEKHQLRLLVRELEARYDLRLGEAVFLHPTPFFIHVNDDWVFEATLNGHIHIIGIKAVMVNLPLVDVFRETGKKLGAFTYADAWRMEDRMSRLPFFDDVFYTFW